MGQQEVHGQEPPGDGSDIWSEPRSTDKEAESELPLENQRNCIVVLVFARGERQRIIHAD